MKFWINLIIVISVLVPLELRAGTSSGLHLTGNVLSSCLVDIDPTPVATNLDLTGSGHSNTLVAEVRVVSNFWFRTVMRIKDSNGGKLVNTSNSSYQVPFTINYTSPNKTENNYVLSNSFQQIDAYWWANPTNPFVAQLSINLTANPSLASGVYEDTITISCNWI